jgi:nuclear cap-binding protein subunit 1
MVLASLKTLDLSGFEDVISTFPQPYSEFANIDPVVSPPFPLPSVLVPPEIIEMDTLSADAGEDTQVKKEEWPEYFLRFFENDVCATYLQSCCCLKQSLQITPDANSPSGYAVRSALLDIVDIFELNRKECARLLLEYPKWAIPGTFKSKPGAPMDSNPLPGKGWQLESTIIEVDSWFLVDAY